jgi:Zn-dependent protease with chaperone function
MSTPLAPGIPVLSAAPTATATAQRVDPTTDDLLAALPTRIEPVRRSRAFCLRLALAGFTLLVVLTLYVALVVITSYGIWSHLASPGLVAAVRRAFVEPGPYIAFCVAGPILCVFLVKPIFTLGGAEQSGVTLERSTEPRLFAFIERLCAAQGAPAPRQVRVNTEVNASAALRHGLISLFRTDLALTIGLPLARMMTLREFTGVLAHEFGHFAQGGAMRLSYLIRSMIVFMLRIVHERDGFDEALIEASRFRVLLDIRITLVLALFSLFMLAVQGFLWLARGLLKGLAWIGLIVTGALLREMEYDADRHEARIVGSESFAAVGTRLIVLGAARDAAVSLQARWWQSHRLADDVPALVAALAARLTAQPEAVRELTEQALQATTGRFDTHPSLRDRLASVAREAEAGAFAPDAPATALFGDLDGLCRAATLAEYQATLSFAFQSARILPVAELLYEVEGDRASSKRLARFTQGCPLAACHLDVSPSDIAAPDEVPAQEDAARSLDAIRQRVRELAPAATEAAQRLEAARERHTQLGLAVALVQASCPVDPAPFGVPVVDVETVQVALRQAIVDIETAERDLAPFSEVLSNRLRAALRLRHAPGVVADVARCEALATTLAGLNSVRQDMDSLRSRLALVFGLSQQAVRQSSPPQIRRRAYEAGTEARQILTAIHDRLKGTLYPFPMAYSPAAKVPVTPTVGVYLGSVSPPMDPAGIYSRGVEMLTQLRSLEERVIASLAVAAEQVETALGLPPLPDPPPVPRTAQTRK